jgi:hypothetical protein
MADKIADKVIGRRALLALASAGVARWATAAAAPAPAAKRLLLVHGRDQQGQDPVKLKAAWLDALARGAAALGRPLPSGIAVDLPFYGDVLDDFARRQEIPLTTEVRTRGEVAVDQRFLAFEASMADDLRRKAGITDEQVLAEYGPNPRQKGPQNWEWVHAIIRAIDRYGGGVSQSVIELIMRDVYIYVTRAGVRAEIDRIVTTSLTSEPTVIVGHSLGSVVSYGILRSDPRTLAVPLYVTVGSPLAIRAIRDAFRPLRYPPPVRAWFNAFDPRDVVALYPLDDANFPVTPAIENHDRVRNATDNRHGISGYLDDPLVVTRILAALAA